MRINVEFKVVGYEEKPVKNDTYSREVNTVTEAKVLIRSEFDTELDKLEDQMERILSMIGAIKE